MRLLNSFFGTSFLMYLNLVVAFLCFNAIRGGFAEKNSAFFIFGDSSVDPGNNNYIETIPENRADYKPYGQNGFFKEPTGRFSDGRIIVDYLAEYANLPIIPPYLQPSADYSHGVNFASGGAGVLSTTNQGLVIDFKTQLEYFDKVRLSLTEKFGSAEAEEIISNAVYFISMGSNDYMGGYLGNPKMQELHNPEEYVRMVIGNLTQGIQELCEKGAKKLAFLSLCPLGCLPALRALNPQGHDAGCFEQATALAFAHNNALRTVLPNLELLLKGTFKYSNSNFYDWLLDRINDPTTYGFKEGVSACCGAGPHRGILTCGGTKKDPNYELCENPNDYVWFDSFHPTERIHEQFAKALWNGPSTVVGPYNLEDLFLDKNKQTIADIVDDIPETQQIF
ncbi:hypothetical protein ACH5RR_003936 [Cinchona calisaya]|uniref:GDSL esterase/lipase 5-like n=1 Tax=Cinchona calisaya TaxID=153742 RepID=A0ABD3AWF9_9GENT